MLSFYQHLPQSLSPIVFSVGFFNVRWYSIAYLMGVGVVYLFLRYRVVRGEGLSLISNFQFPISNQAPNPNKSNFKHLKLVQSPKFNPPAGGQNLILDWIAYSVAGLLVGGRLGYVLFYNPSYYLDNLWAIVSPYDFSSGVWTGIFGMSYFGGVLGVVLASWIFTRKNKINFWNWADFIIPAIPAGYFFGRLGNFLNGELYGRITEMPWGMYFSTDLEMVLRHPSQLYEALLEGLVLFLILWLRKNKIEYSGQMIVKYTFWYGLFRFGIEFFRAPDIGSGLWFNFLTLGQFFSLGFMMAALILWCALSKRKKVL